MKELGELIEAVLRILALIYLLILAIVLVFTNHDIDNETVLVALMIWTYFVACNKD